jgi:hypothetical protein
VQGPRRPAPAGALSAGRCLVGARDERRAREAEHPQPERAKPKVIHPDLAEALGAAEDTLAAALGRDVKARARGDRCVVEIEFDHPAEAVELARSMLAAGVRRVVRERRAAATIGVRTADKAGD